MKITKSQLQKIINEEVANLNEQREADQIMAEVYAFQEGLDAGTLEKGAAAAGKAADALGKIVANPLAKKWLGILLKKVKLGFVAELLLDLTPEDVQGLKSLGSAARGQADKLAKTVAQPGGPKELGPNDPTVAIRVPASSNPKTWK